MSGIKKILRVFHKHLLGYILIQKKKKKNETNKIYYEIYSRVRWSGAVDPNQIRRYRFILNDTSEKFSSV